MNLTSMLLMITISIGIMDRLQDLVFVRMIDTWPAFLQLVPSPEVLLTSIAYNRGGSYDKTSTNLHVMR